MNEDTAKSFLGSRAGKAITVLAWVGAIFLAILAINELRYPSNYGEQMPQNIITVSGEGEAFAKPDTATFTFTVEETALVVADAQKKADDKIKKALDFLKKNDIEEKDTKTISYQIYPKYEYEQVVCTQWSCPPPGTPKIVGYNVSQTIEVKIRDIAKAGDLLSGIGEVGVMNLSGLNFTIDDEDELQASARQEAIDKAQEKAKVLAKQLGVKLVRIVNFSESGSYPPIYYTKYDTASIEGRGGMGGEAVAIAPGETRIVSNVTITYEIR